MITPYTQAAQAPRIDIYDPFPFQEVASMAMKKDKQYGDTLSGMDKYVSDIANIEAVTPNDQAYLQKVKSELTDKINKAVTSGIDLGDGIEARQLIKSIGDSVDLSKLKSIMSTTSNYKEYLDQANKLGEKHDPLMDDTTGSLSQWDSTKNGSWRGQAGAAVDYDKAFKSMFEPLDKHGRILHDYQNGYFQYGRNEEDINNVLSERAPSLLSDTETARIVKRYKRQWAGTDMLYRKDANGNTIPKSDMDIALEAAYGYGKASSMWSERRGSLDLLQRMKIAELKQAKQNNLALTFADNIRAQQIENKRLGLGNTVTMPTSTYDAIIPGKLKGNNYNITGSDFGDKIAPAEFDELGNTVLKLQPLVLNYAKLADDYARAQKQVEVSEKATPRQVGRVVIAEKKGLRGLSEDKRSRDDAFFKLKAAAIELKRNGINPDNPSDQAKMEAVKKYHAMKDVVDVEPELKDVYTIFHVNEKNNTSTVDNGNLLITGYKDRKADDLETYFKELGKTNEKYKKLNLDKYIEASNSKKVTEADPSNDNKLTEFIRTPVYHVQPFTNALNNVLSYSYWDATGRKYGPKESQQLDRYTIDAAHSSMKGQPITDEEIQNNDLYNNELK